MARRETMFEYRGWPEDASPYCRALRDLFGFGVAEFSTDTYILSPVRPLWVLVISAGAQLELHVRTGVQWPVSAWRMPLASAFPLRSGVTRTLQEAFPGAELPDRILTAHDLRICLRGHAFICTVTKRIVRLRRGNCNAEITEIDADGYQAENFAITAKHYAPVAHTIAAMPQPRLPNLDYGAWLQCRIQGRPPVALIADNARFASV